MLLIARQRTRYLYQYMLNEFFLIDLRCILFLAGVWLSGQDSERGTVVTVPAHQGVSSMNLGLRHYMTAGVRLSGQDSERGTFNQRHAIMFDQLTGRRWGANIIRMS